MRRWRTGGLTVVVVVLAALLAWWWWPDASGSAEARTPEPAPASANEGALPTSLKESAWKAPIKQRGARSLTGVVLREGRPVAGAVVTAVAAHGDEVLSDLPCKCDNHCGQMLLQCGCAEASGQLVELVATRTGEGAPLARATSDADGAFTLTGLEETTLTLFADAPDGVGWLANVALDARETKILITPGWTLHGRVQTTDEKPARGALVTAIFAEHSRFFDAIVDEKGEFHIGPLPAGTYAVVAMQGGLLPDHKQANDEEAEALELELSVPRTVSGVVLADGAPVSGATVKLEGMHRKRTLTTDTKGEFRIDRLRPGNYELTAESPAGLGVVSTLISKHEDRADVTITIAPGLPLSGRVVTETAAPVAGARVSVLVGRDRWRNTDSDDTGAFRFEGVDGDEHDLYAQKEGLLDVRSKGRGGQSGVELRMGQPAILSGLVRTTTGELVLKYSVTATAIDGGGRRQEDLTKKSTDGGFALEVWPGGYTLRVEAPPHAPATLTASAPANGLVLVVKPGAKIRGLVLDPEGQPAPKVRVMATRADDREFATTDVAGRFEVTGLEAGTWRVSAAKREGYMPVWRASGGVKLADGETAELVLRPKEGVALAGVVLSSEGQPLEGVTVRGWQAPADGGVDEEGIDMSMTKSDGEGRFRLRSLRAGKVQLMAQLDKSESEANLTATAPDENVVIKLSVGTTISGRVVNGEGKPVTAFKVLHRPFDPPDGRFTMPISPRTRTVAFDAEGYAQLIRDVQLKEGENPLGEIVLQRGRPVSGVVRDARTRAPISGALIDVGLEDTDNDFYLAEAMGAVKSDSQGRYRLPAVDPSSTWIFVTAPRYVAASQPLHGNSADFALQPASALRVKVVDTGGAPITQSRVYAQQGTRMRPLRPTSVPATFESLDLAPGSWRVSAQTRDGQAFRPVQVTLGDTPTELVLRAATDGVTVELQGLEGLDAVLVPGNLQNRPFPELFAAGDFVLAPGGVAKNVLPGPWTVVAVKRESREVATQAIEVKPGNNFPWTITPQWRVMTAEEFGR